MSRLDATARYLGLIARMHAVHKCKIPWIGHVEVRPERPLDERIHDVGKGDEYVELKEGYQ
jgi:hypothetical protein